MRRYIFSLAACLIGMTGFALPAAQAQEACGEATIGFCFPEYVTIPALVATDGGYTAIAVSGSNLEVLRLDAEAQIVDRFLLPPPDWLQGADMPSIDKLVAGPNGDVMGVGTLTSGNRQYGVIFFLTAAGLTSWSTALHAGDENSIILYSGAYDPAEKRYLAVGRHTDGADSGLCTKWSRGLIISIAENDITALSGYFDGPQEPGLENRIAYYDIAPTQNRGQFVAVGFATKPNPNGNGCQDNAVAVTVRGGANNTQWNVSSRYMVGSPEANEVAFAVVETASRKFLMAGQGVDVGTEARASFLSEFEISNSAPQIRYDPFPQDGSDSSGGDRYRTLTPLSNGSYVVAGSISESRSARNQGVWLVQPEGLASPGPINFLTREAGSEILAAAGRGDGRVLAVGRHGSDRGDIGWLGFIYGMRIAVDRRDPDGALELLTPQQASAGVMTLSAGDIAAGHGHRDIRFGAGSEFELRVSLSDATDLAVSALPLDGDLDLVLLDGAGKVRSMSSNLGEAGEFVLADLEPGDYSLKIVAVSDVSEYELRIRSGVSLGGPVLDSLNALGAAGRQKLAALLAGGGYEIPASPDIGFGAGSLLALLAYYNSFNTEVDAAGVQQFITTASLSADDE